MKRYKFGCMKAPIWEVLNPAKGLRALAEFCNFAELITITKKSCL